MSELFEQCTHFRNCHSIVKTMENINLDHFTIASRAEQWKAIAAKEKEIQDLRRSIANAENKMRLKALEEQKLQISSIPPEKIEELMKQTLLVKKKLADRKKRKMRDEEAKRKRSKADEQQEPCQKRQRREDPQMSCPPPMMEAIDGVPISKLVTFPPPLIMEATINGVEISELVKNPPPNIIREIQDQECAKPLFYSNIQEEFRIANWWK